MKKLYVCLIIAFITIACGSSTAPTPVAPVVPVVPACQSHNTAEITFGNTSVNSTYTVLFDGSTRTTLAPGQSSTAYTESAGIQHTVTFRYANSTILACSTSTPVFSQCSSNTLTCKF